MAGKPRQIVVDASLAGPSSRRCRETLRVFEEDSEHSAVFDPQLTDEWRRHETDFSRRWRVRMHSRKRIVPLAKLDPLPWEARLSRQRFSQHELRAIEKDLHLIRAAVATDWTVLSRDSKVRGLFHQAAMPISDLGKVVWVDPESDVDALDWLRSGAKRDAKRQLRNPSRSGGSA